MTTARWPRRQFEAVPGFHVAVLLAAEVRRLVADDDARCDVERLCDLGGFRYRTASLGRGSASHEALLVPNSEGGFEILVDPGRGIGRARHDITARHRQARRRIRFRIAHEVGHSFFYDRRIMPPRRLLDRSESEEQFCDVFARALLVPPATAARENLVPKSIVNLADRLDVSVEVAGRALAEVHGGSVVLGLQTKEQAVSVLWSAGAIPFSSGSRLRGQWLAFACEATAERVFDLGSRWGTFDAAIMALGEAYRVAVLRPSRTSGCHRRAPNTEGPSES